MAWTPCNLLLCLPETFLYISGKDERDRFEEAPLGNRKFVVVLLFRVVCFSAVFRHPNIGIEIADTVLIQTWVLLVGVKREMLSHMPKSSVKDRKSPGDSKQNYQGRIEVGQWNNMNLMKDKLLPEWGGSAVLDATEGNQEAKFFSWPKCSKRLKT